MSGGETAVISPTAHTPTFLPRVPSRRCRPFAPCVQLRRQCHRHRHRPQPHKQRQRPQPKLCIPHQFAPAAQQHIIQWRMHVAGRTFDDGR
ncbi:MAG: hypothetical protein R3E31_09285 [Chloroflexota bacterium]